MVSVVSRSFGFDPADNPHHFLVNLPRGAAQQIEISEHFTYGEDSGPRGASFGHDPDAQIRVVLPRPKWDAVAEDARAEFNLRLRRTGRRTGSWRVGHNLLRCELGKELVLLAWAIEDADPSLVPNALANWKGLLPEERWWLYTQTAAATGHGIEDRGKGWRKAVRFALTENPVSLRASDVPLVPEFYRLAERAEQRHLFEDKPGIAAIDEVR